MKTANLLQIMEAHSIRLPYEGTGRKGQIVTRDLEKVIGDFYLQRDYTKDSAEYKHIQLRRTWTPMKAYRFNNLNTKLQAEVFEDNNDWYAERKLNGWRMMVTFIPKTNPMFWGGNLSTVNFLPTNYTRHILFKTKELGAVPTTLGAFKNIFPEEPLILDCEVVVKDKREDLSEHASLIQVQEILGSSPDRARILQTDATLQFKIFDVIKPSAPRLNYRDRKITLSLDTMCRLRFKKLTQFSLVPHYLAGKKRYVNKVWKEGGEGIILKKGGASYLPGSRLKSTQIKVKRAHSGEVGDDIDAFVTKIYDTPEWKKKGLIGGIELSLYLNREEQSEPHVIAAVTSIPDDVRKDITDNPTHWLDRVLIVDGQELSARNRRLLHASIDWERGRRYDKNPIDCVMELEELEGVKF